MSTTSLTSPCPCGESPGEVHARWWSAGFPRRHLEHVNELASRGEAPRYSPSASEKLGDALDCLIDGGMVALIGIRGNGKTLAACHMARYFAWHCPGEIKYTHVADMFAQIRSASIAQERSEDLVVSDWASYGLLVIDELQERRESDWEQTTLTWLLDKRYGAQRSTLMISNLKPSEFVKSVGESVVDRMRETGVIVECDWPSFRGAEA